MTVLLHAASPTGLLLLQAADLAGLLPAGPERALVLDSSTPGGRAVAALLTPSDSTSPSLPRPVAAPELGPGLGPVVDVAQDGARTVASLNPSALVLDVTSAPATAELLARSAPRATVTALDDGLRLVQPTPEELPPATAQRITALMAPPLIPGLDPVLLREVGAALRPLPLAFIEEAATGWAWTPELSASRPLLVLGTSAPDLGRAAEAEREHLAARLVRAGLDVGAGCIVLGPEPGQPLADTLALSEAAREAGLPFVSLPAAVPVPVVHSAVKPVLSVSVDSPWLLFLRTVRGARVQSVATGRYLPRLAEVTDPARVRLATVDALLRRGLPTPVDEGAVRGPAAGTAVLQRVVDAVAYSVAPQRLGQLRDEALPTLGNEPALRSAYVPRARVQELRQDQGGEARRRPGRGKDAATSRGRTATSGPDLGTGPDGVRDAANVRRSPGAGLPGAGLPGAARPGDTRAGADHAASGTAHPAQVRAVPRREPAPITQGLRILSDVVITGLLRRPARVSRPHGRKERA